MTGVLEPNDTLMKAELLAQGQIHGPEDTAVDAQGRVYAGLQSADTVQGRADLVLAELKRTGAFERNDAFAAFFASLAQLSLVLAGATIDGLMR